MLFVGERKSNIQCGDERHNTSQDNVQSKQNLIEGEINAESSQEGSETRDKMFDGRKGDSNFLGRGISI